MAKFFENQNVVWRFSGDVYRVISCNGCVTTVEGSDGERQTLMVGELVPYGHHMLVVAETGEIDMAFLRKAATIRARREYGGSNVPPSYLRDAIRWYMDTALMMRAARRLELGLPDDTVYQEMPADLAALRALPGVQREL